MSIIILLKNAFTHRFTLLQQNLEASEKMSSLYSSDCLKITASDPVPPIQFEETHEFTSETTTNATVDFVGILTCAIEAGRNNAEDYELTEVWKMFESMFEAHLANITDCAIAGDEEPIRRAPKENDKLRQKHTENS